jgi:hypothetical protein
MADKLVAKTSKFLFNNTTLTGADGTDLSDYVESIELPNAIEDLDGTTFGGAFKDHEAGLEDNSVTVNFKEGVSLATVNGVLWAQRGNKVFCSAKAASSAIAAGNPEWQFKVLVLGVPLSLQVGQIVKTAVTWPIVSIMTRDTTP